MFSKSSSRIRLFQTKPRDSNRISRAGIVSPYSSALHGPTRAPMARTLPQVPYDLWLKCRNSIAPFKESCLVVGCKEHEADADSFRDKASEHFRNVLDSRFSLVTSASLPSAFLIPPSNSASSLTKKKSTNSGEKNDRKNKAMDDDDDENDVHSIVANYCSTSGKNGLDIVVFSPSCTTAAASAATIMTTSTNFDDENSHFHNNNNDNTNTKPKLISNPQDIFFAFETFSPFIRPHGCLCLTGTDILASSELICSVGGGDSTASSSISQDWRDLCSFLDSQSTKEEKFMSLLVEENSVRENDRGKTVFDEQTYQHLKQISTSFGFSNMTYYEFETEYPLDLDFKILCGLIRKIPAYRRIITNETVVQQEDQDTYYSVLNDSSDLVRKGKEETNALAAFSQREFSSSSSASSREDPLEVFVDLVKYKMNSTTSFGGIPKLSKKSALGDMRLKLKHWMWVCDRRPRSKDSISFASRKSK